MNNNKRVRNTFHDNKKLTVINFFGGPCAGKSTTASELFALMKKRNYKVELVHEASKDMVWEMQDHVFGEQDWIFAHQHRLIRRLTMHDIDIAVVDSSILLSLFYMPDDFPQSFRPFVVDVFNTYDNINIMLDRNPDIEYVQAGRNESYNEAVEKDRAVHQWFTDNNVPHVHVTAGDGAAAECLNAVVAHYLALVSH